MRFVPSGRQFGPEIIPNGTLVRYDSGETALLEIEQALVGHGGSIAYYGGKQCMGGYRFAYHHHCEPASPEDYKTWQECKKWRKS